MQEMAGKMPAGLFLPGVDTRPPVQAGKMPTFPGRGQDAPSPNGRRRAGRNSLAQKTLAR